jgi:prepilin-type processing-associated H-X9-DG protein
LNPGSNIAVNVALTSYLGVEGLDLFAKDGVLYLDSQIRLANITDGTSNTLLVGERPPSEDKTLGWCYAGGGQQGEGSTDMVLGVREVNIWPFGGDCLGGPYHFVSGRVNEECDVFHFWSMHPGGANFLFADGAVRFLSYSVDPLLPALASRAGRETVDLP